MCPVPAPERRPAGLKACSGNRIESRTGKSTIQDTKNGHRLFSAAGPSPPWKKSGTPSRVPRCTGAAPQRKAAFAENLFPGFLFAVFPEGAQGALRIRSMTSGILKKAAGRNSEFLPARPSFPRNRKGTWGRCRYRRSLASSGLAEIRVPLWGKAISRRKRGRAFFHALWAFLRQGSRV